MKYMTYMWKIKGGERTAVNKINEVNRHRLSHQQVKKGHD